MKTIDITAILSPDLKSRVAVQDVLDFVRNTDDNDITLDFSKVQFATRSFIDEFYNVFVKPGCIFPLTLDNVPQDIAYMLHVVSTTQHKSKKMESAGNVTYCTSLDELKQCLATI